MFANSSSKHLTWIGNRPPYTSSALSHKRLKSCEYIMDTTKLKVSSVSEIITKSAVFLSPSVSSSSSSSLIKSLSSLISNGASLAPQEIRIDFAVFPETNCQGLFNQIHKNLQKRCQKHRMAPDTSFDRLHFSVQQVFAEIRIVWQLVDIWLPAPLDFGQFQRIGFLQCMIVACHI